MMCFSLRSFCGTLPYQFSDHNDSTCTKLQSWYLMFFGIILFDMLLSVAQDTVEALAFSLSMGVAASCPEAICESTDAVPQIIVVEQVASHGLEPGDLEQVQEVPVESTVTATYVEARTISKIKRSLLLEKKLHTDTEIMRGASAASFLGVVFLAGLAVPMPMSHPELCCSCLLFPFSDPFGILFVYLSTQHWACQNICSHLL